jgi:plasmid maintenance system antidote protein VapI
MVFCHRPDRDNDPDNSGLLFNVVLKRMGFSSDRMLADWFEIHGSTLSKIRHGRGEVSADMILQVHEGLGIPVKDIRLMISGEMPK